MHPRNEAIEAGSACLLDRSEERRGAAEPVSKRQSGAHAFAADPVGAAFVAEEEAVPAGPGSASTVVPHGHRAGAGDDDHARTVEEGPESGHLGVAGDGGRATEPLGQCPLERPGGAFGAETWHPDADPIERCRAGDRDAAVGEMRREQGIHGVGVEPEHGPVGFHSHGPGGAPAGVDAEERAGRPPDHSAQFDAPTFLWLVHRLSWLRDVANFHYSPSEWCIVTRMWGESSERGAGGESGREEGRSTGRSPGGGPGGVDPAADLSSEGPAVVSPTEMRNPRTVAIDLLPTLQILQLLHEEDRAVPDAVEPVLPLVARLIDEAARRVSRGGRVHYFGAGSSGRIALLDATELVPTFGLERSVVVAHLAGADRAMAEAMEGMEDDEAAGSRDAGLVTAADVVIGVTASGSTPYVIGAVRRARSAGAYCALVTSNPRAALLDEVDCGIVVDTGPEAITGSTRLKAATAEKLVVNGFSTALMVRLGRTYSNLMVEVVGTNEKLRSRQVGIVQSIAGVDARTATDALRRADGDVAVASVLAASGVDVETARQRLAAAGGRLREVLGAPHPSSARRDQGYDLGVRMAEEMSDQPKILESLLGRRRDVASVVERLVPDEIRGVVLVGRGSSQNVALYARYLFEERLGLPSAVVAPSVFTQYRARPRYRGCLAVALSQSGETPEIVEVLRALRQAGAVGLALTNDPTSALAAAADCVIDIGAGPEEAIPATKTVTGQMLACVLLAATLPGSPLALEGIEGLTQAVEAALADEGAAEVGRRLVGATTVVTLARGYLYSAARETALKIREATGMPTEAYSSAELQHGPIAGIRRGTPVVAMTGDPTTDPDLRATMADLTRRGARVVELAAVAQWGAGESTPGRGQSGPTGLVPDATLPAWLRPVVAVVRGQQVALGLARALGRDPDRPPGLSKVTATR